MDIRDSKTLAALTLTLSLTLTSFAQKVTRDITYTTDSAGEQRGDFYAPVGAGTFPVIIFLHGGSWRSGNKGNYARLGPDLAAQGYAGFSIDYDLHAHAWPLAFDETEAAIRFMRTHAAEYHVNPDQILIAGTSAGGQLAALAALTPKGDDTKVAAVIELSGVFDLHANAGTINRYLGGNCYKIPDICDAASPNQHIAAGEPPFFIGHGTDDKVVPYASAQAFTVDMRKAGNTVTTYDAAGGPHMYWEKNEFYTANRDALLKFLQTNFPPAPAAAAPASN